MVVEEWLPESISLRVDQSTNKAKFICQSLRRVKSVLVLAVFQMWEKILWEINMYLTRLAKIRSLPNLINGDWARSAAISQ